MTPKLNSSSFGGLWSQEKVQHWKIVKQFSCIHKDWWQIRVALNPLRLAQGSSCDIPIGMGPSHDCINEIEESGGLSFSVVRILENVHKCISI